MTESEKTIISHRVLRRAFDWRWKKSVAMVGQTRRGGDKETRRFVGTIASNLPLSHSPSLRVCVASLGSGRVAGVATYVNDTFGASAIWAWSNSSSSAFWLWPKKLANTMGGKLCR